MKRTPRVRVTRNGSQVDYGPFEGEEAEIIRAAAAEWFDRVGRLPSPEELISYLQYGVILRTDVVRAESVR